MAFNLTRRLITDIPNDPLANNFLSDIACQCAQEALDKCQAGTADGNETMNRLLSLDNWLYPGSSLLSQCGQFGGKSLQELMGNLSCAGEWTGTLTGSEVGTLVGPLMVGSTSWEYYWDEHFRYNYRAAVAKAVLQDGLWVISLVGTVDRSFTRSTVATSKTTCPTTTERINLVGYSTTPATFEVQFQLPIEISKTFYLKGTTAQLVPSSGSKFITVKNDCVAPPTYRGSLYPASEGISMSLATRNFASFTFPTLTANYIEAQATGTKLKGGLDGADVTYDVKLTLRRRP